MTVDVLAFAAHPDDVELFAGGTMIRLHDLGHTTAIADLTRGERASHGTPELRAQEAEAAAQVMGLSFRDNLGLPDGGVSPWDEAQLAAVISVLRARRPEIVLVPWIEERHPDHAAAGLLVGRAVFFGGVRKMGAGEPWRPRHVLHYQMRHQMTPSFVVDTSQAIEKKRAAIACHASQVGRRPGEDATLLSSPRAIEAIETRDRYYGSMIGTSHGEPLRSAAVLGIADPVAHFRANPFTEAHAFEALR